MRLRKHLPLPSLVCLRGCVCVSVSACRDRSHSLTWPQILYVVSVSLELILSLHISVSQDLEFQIVFTICTLELWNFISDCIFLLYNSHFCIFLTVYKLSCLSDKCIFHYLSLCWYLCSWKMTAHFTFFSRLWKKLWKNHVKLDHLLSCSCLASLFSPKPWIC